MNLNNLLLEGTLVEMKKTRRRCWIKVDSDGVIVKMYADGDMARRMAQKLNKGDFIRVLGKVMNRMVVKLNHVEFKGNIGHEVCEE